MNGDRLIDPTIIPLKYETTGGKVGGFLQNQGSATMLLAPRVCWRWYVFGKADDGRHLMTVMLPLDPPLWRRLLTRVFLGSVWERVDNE